MNTLVKFFGCMAVAILLCVQACSVDNDVQEGESAVGQPATADWIHPACSAEALGTPAGDPQSCNGPWTYTYREIWLDHSCGDTAACKQRSSCTSWDLNAPGDGLGFTVESSPQLTGGFFECENGRCSGAQPEAKCRDDAIALRNSLLATRSGISQTALNGFSVTWEAINVTQDEFGCGPVDQLCRFTLSYECLLHVNNFPTQRTDARPVCPCEELVPKECPRVNPTLVSTEVPRTIPDGVLLGATSTIKVPGNFDAKQILVSVDVKHTARGNLLIWVVAPSGRVVVLSNQQGGAEDDYVATALDISSSLPPGMPTAGTWKLQVFDVVRGDVGRINAFSLQIVGLPKVVTDPGTRMPLDPGAASPGSVRREFVQAPTCQTCDGIPLDSDEHAQQKFACLESGLATATADLKLSLAGRMKLLLQVAGERLTPAQRARVEALYDQDAASGPACSVPVTWDSACRSQAPASLPGQLQLCQDLVSNERTSTGAASVELPHCLDQIKAIGGLDDSCRLAMRDTGDDMAQTVLKRAQASFAGDFGAALAAAFARIAAWWQAATGLAHGDQPWFDSRSSALERWLWTTIEAQRGPLPQTPPANDSDAATLLADLASSRLKDDVSVLNFAFAPGQTTSAPPLLALTGDALKSLADRLERLEPIHDAGCRFLPCVDPKSGAVTFTAISQLMRALASLPDASALASALAAAPDLQTRQPELYRALLNVRDQHAYLRTAWALFGRSEPFSQLATITNLPAEAQGLAAIVRAASVAWASYQRNGEFLPWNRPRLTAGTLRQAELVGFLNGFVATADGDRALYTQQRLETVKDLLEQSRSGAAQQSLTAQLNELVTRMGDIASRIDGIEQRDLTERAALAGFQATFETLTTSGVVDPNMAYQTEVIPTFSARGSDSKYPNAGIRNVVRDQFHVERLRAGQTLRIHVAGQWSPTCALREGNIVDDTTGLPVQIVLGQSEAGPEGFYVVADNHRYSAAAIGVSAAGTVQRINSSCASDSLSFSNCTLANLPKEGDGAFGQQNSGSETRISATFTSGMRLSTTPYPEAPAGSLVAVITRKGVTGGAADPEVLDIRVVHRDDAIVATKPPHLDGWPDDGEIEVHFVVNDRAQKQDGSPCDRNNTAALSLDLTRSTPAGAVAQLIGPAMSDALAALVADTPSVIAQGELSAAESSALHNTTWSRVQDLLTPSGIGLTGLPAELRQLFETYVERELASIARRAQRHALQQEFIQLGLQIDAIRRQQAFSTDQDRLLFLVPRWRLRDLAGTKLASSAATLAEALTAYAAPVFDLRDPASATNFRAQVRATATSATSDLQITGPYENAVDTLVGLSRATAAAIGGAQFELPASQRRTIVIAIPRPPGNGRPAWTGSWQTASPATAKAFWDSVFTATGAISDSAVLALSPADIYSKPGGGSRLACMDVAPVVRHAGFYFDTGGTTAALGPAGVEIVTTAAITSPVAFPLVGSMLSFPSTDPLGIPMRVRALNGNTASVIVDAAGNPANFGIWPQDLDAGAGISPFTSFRLNMQVFAPPASSEIQNVLTKATAMFAVFEVERRTANVDAWLPGVCASN